MAPTLGCAIYASLASHLAYFTPPVGASINLRQDDRDFFKRICAEHFGKANSAFTIVATMNQFLHRYQDRGRLDSFIRNPIWVEIEERVLRAISVSTPIGCYIDTLDETFGASPAAVTDCQVGLLSWIIRKSLDPNVTNRIHLIVAVRDTVFASFMQSENAARYNRSDMIRCLDWTDEAAGLFLTEKVARLPPSARVAPKEKDPITSWLGFNIVPNGMRQGREEPVSSLIVRHTRFLPREIVEIGNAVGGYVRKCIAAKTPVDRNEIPQIVMDQARVLSERALGTAVDHMMALDPDHDRAVVNNGFRQSVIQAIDNEFIPSLRSERFSRATLEHAERAFSDSFGGWAPKFDWRSASVGEMLWLHGLIGFEDFSGPQPVAKYFSSTKSIRADVSGELPKADHYYLHAALLRSNRTRIAETPPIVASAVLEQ